MYPDRIFADKPAKTGTTSTNSTAGLYEFGAGINALASGYASYMAGKVEARQYKTQQMFLDLQASAQKLKSRENAVFLRNKFLQTISSANVSFAKRGVSTGSGIGKQYTLQSLENLGKDLQANELNSDAIQNSLTLQVSQAQFAQRTARNMGLLTSGQAFAKAGTNFASLLKTAG